MDNVKLITKGFIILNLILVFLVPAVNCTGFQDSFETNTPWDLRSESKEEKSFFHRVLSGKHKLFEEDLFDVLQRPTKYDYLREATEDLRLYSRSNEDEILILNLQWKDESIFLNDFKTVVGRFKKKRGVFADGKDKFFYRLYSNTNQPIYEDYFNIPQELHFDILDEETGELMGGSIKRSEVDFTIKIPLSDKSAQKIIFFKQTDLDWIKNREAFSTEVYDLNASKRVIGEILF